MLSEELTRICEAEAKADEMREQGKNDAKNIIAKADIDAAGIVSEAKQKASASYEMSLKQAEERAKAEYESEMKALQADLEKLESDAKAKEKDIVKYIKEMVKSSVNS